MSACPRSESVGAYLLGALDEQEHGSFDEHLRDCGDCRRDVDRLRHGVDALPAGVPQVAPPPELKRRIMTDVRADAELMRAAGPAADRVPKRRRWPVLTALPVAAALAVVVVLLVHSGGHSSRVISAQVTQPGAQARVVLAGADHTLRVSGLAQAPAGRVYEVWTQRGTSAPVPTHALFDVPRGGGASVALPRDLHGVRVVMVTLEPMGGSLRPTSAPVITAKLD